MGESSATGAADNSSNVDDSSNSNDTNTLRSSFGVELEFVIGLQLREVPPPRAFESHPGRPIQINEDNIDEAFPVIKDLLLNTIREVTEGRRGDRVITSPDQLVGDGQHLTSYVDWDVKRDISVYVAADENSLWINDGMRWPPIYWHDVEITSPAFFATENSYDEIRRVVNALNEKWWLYAPKAAGLHVHYGRGSDWIPFEHIRKMSALLYAADPIIAQMHPEHRRRCDFSQSNRLYSALAYGVSPVLAERKYRGEYDGQVGQEAEPIYPDNLYRSRPDDRPTRTRALTFPTVFKRGSLKGYEFDQGTFDGTGRFGLRNIHLEDLVPNQDRSKPLKILVGLLQILACDKAPQVAILQQNFRNNRSAYSFDAYGRLYRTARQDRVGRPAKRTVEFRQAPGTVDPDEIIAQCKICVGLGDFAGTTDTAELFVLIQDLISADGNPTWYDVFDLLFELNLVEEARIIQRRVARDNNIEIIDEVNGIHVEPLARIQNIPVSKSRFQEFKDFFSRVWNRI